MAAICPVWFLGTYGKRRQSQPKTAITESTTFSHLPLFSKVSPACSVSVTQLGLQLLEYTHSSSVNEDIFVSSLLFLCPLYLYVIPHSFYSTMSGYRRHHPWSSRGEQIAVLELEVGVKKLICCLILKLPSRVSGPDPGRVVVNFNHSWSWSWIIVPGLSIPEGQSVRDVTVPVLTVLWEGQFLCPYVCVCVRDNISCNKTSYQGCHLPLMMECTCHSIMSEVQWQRARWGALQCGRCECIIALTNNKWNRQSGVNWVVAEVFFITLEQH